MGLNSLSETMRLSGTTLDCSVDVWLGGSVAPKTMEFPKQGFKNINTISLYPVSEPFRTVSRTEAVSEP